MATGLPWPQSEDTIRRVPLLNGLRILREGWCGTARTARREVELRAIVRQGLVLAVTVRRGRILIWLKIRSPLPSSATKPIVHPSHDKPAGGGAEGSTHHSSPCTSRIGRLPAPPSEIAAPARHWPPLLPGFGAERLDRGRESCLARGVQALARLDYAPAPLDRRRIDWLQHWTKLRSTARLTNP